MDEKPRCGGDSSRGDNKYNVPLHVAGLFVIFAASLIGAGFPVLVKRYKNLCVPPAVFFACKHFGTGVLTATAFVHLLPTAWGNLLNPCLPDFFIKKYPPLAGIIMMASIFILFIIEIYLNVKTGGHSHGGPTGDVSAGSSHEHHHANTIRTRSDSAADSVDEKKASHITTSEVPMTPTTPTKTTPTTTTITTTITTTTTTAAPSPSASSSSSSKTAAVTAVDEEAHLGPLDEHTFRKLSANITLLEGGILFHSVFVGMTLSLTVAGYVVLLTAFIFHQAFEGLGLGARIAAVPWPRRHRFRPWLLVAAFASTAPLGQAIGLAVRNSYDPDSAFGLVLVGVFNAISSGLLLYAALVDLLAEDFLSQDALRLMDHRARAVAFGYVLLGAACMAAVGAFA